MLQSSVAAGRSSTANRGNGLHRGAIHCTLARIAKAIWPHKTPENWAAAAGVQVRIAKYWVAGKHLSDAARIAIIKAIL